MTREQAIDAAVRYVQTRNGRIDIVILNYGTPNEFSEVCSYHLWDIRAEFSRIVGAACRTDTTNSQK